MIDSRRLLADLQGWIRRLEPDLRERVAADAALDVALRAEWDDARAAGRTGDTFETWVDAVLTQAAVHWLLGCVFVRFIEDNGLVERPWLSGPGERQALAQDRHERYFREHPVLSDRDYLLACFTDVAALPGLQALFDSAHNPVFRLGISGDAAMALLAFWRRVDPDTGTLVHDFTDPTWGTRFLGDLYQDLSESTRKRYALLQTPDFIESFILDRTLAPAIAEFGYREVRLIDPTCGSGHFLLGAFARLLDLWSRNEPARPRRDLVQRALDGVFGVDLNPFAVAIARFRLLVEALRASGVARLAAAPDFELHLAVGDTLLHGKRAGMKDTASLLDEPQAYAGTGLEHAYAVEDLDAVKQILGQRYHAVVGNPPYIVVRDSALNAAYRDRFESCHMKYSLGVPFTELFFDLAVPGGAGPAGHVGLITTNSFMKREFGSKLIERVLPRLDLTHLVDTSGAYIPGHGTPTVVLFGRSRAPVADSVCTVMGIKGEPGAPADPSQGLVWRAIVAQVDRVGSESEFVSVANIPRIKYSRHPWSIGGGGVGELREQIEASSRQRLSGIADVGIAVVTLEDDAYHLTEDVANRFDFDPEFLRGFVVGDALRNWSMLTIEPALFPHRRETFASHIDDRMGKWFWRLRINLANRQWFKKSQVDRGLAWFGYGHISREKFVSALSIAFGEIATHNHFVLDRGGRVFNRTAPVIKLRADADEAVHLGLLGLLNSSVGCFWLKQVCFNKGDSTDSAGARTTGDAAFDTYAFNSTKVAEFPIAVCRPLALSALLDTAAIKLRSASDALFDADHPPDQPHVHAAARLHADTLARMIALQEELDWQCYRLYGLLDAPLEAPDPDTLPPLRLGERAFEIVLARRIAAGDETTSWFERHGSTPITELPAHWPPDYRALVERRIACIESDRNIGLVERPEHKRRWNLDPFDETVRRGLRLWLLDRLESEPYRRGAPQLTTVSRLADIARMDAGFMQVGELYAGHADFDPVTLVDELVASESVPFLPVLRYAESGLRKRAQWEATWALQRREDVIDAFESDPRRRKERKDEEIGDIPVPPKYQSKDFLKTDFWRLRGGLDVPKERWISYPGCESGADASRVVGWAGWTALQQAQALAAWYVDAREREGWPVERLVPLLAGLRELLPWLLQWHNALDPEFGLRQGDYFVSFVQDEARALGTTVDALAAWQPPARSVRRGRPRAAAK
jgi:hypothetical protein